MEIEKEVSVEELIKILSTKMHRAYSAYHFWKWLEIARNIHIGEKRVKRNLSVMNQCPGFFQTALLGSFYIFVIDLSVFFDKNKKSLSINKVVENLNVSQEDKDKIENIVKSQEINIQKLKDLRDKDIAHVDLDIDRTQNNSIIYKDTEELFLAVQNIFNILSINFDRSSWVWDYFDRDAEGEMTLLFDNLERGENEKLIQLKAKWNL